VLKYGLLNTFRHGIIPLLTNFKQFKMSAREARFSGVGLDVFLHTRSNMLFDSFADIGYGNRAEQFMQYGTSKIGQIALFDYWNQYMKQFTAVVANGTISQNIADVALGKATRSQKIFLAQFQIGEEEAKKLYHLITEEGGGSEVHPGVWMPNTENWTDVTDEQIDQYVREKTGKALQKDFDASPDTIDPKGLVTEEEYDALKGEAWLFQRRKHEGLSRLYRAAIGKAVDDTIVTPGLERPNWVDASTTGRLISQFRSYTLSSTFKVAYAMGQDARVGNMAPILTGSAFSLALGMLSYYTWAISVGGDTQARMENELEAAINGDEDALRRWADEAINRSGLLGVLSEVQKFAERVPALAPYASLSGKPPSRSPGLNPVTEMMGPTWNLIQNSGRIAVTLDDPTRETFKLGKQMTPYQNHFLFRQGFDRVNKAIAGKFGVNLE
jgi:hypothetical protein